MSGADQVALVPAHQRADQRHAHGGPREPRADALRGVVRAARQQADPVERRAHEEQHAHPEDGALAGQEVLQQEHVVGLRQVGAEAVGGSRIERDGEQRRCPTASVSTRNRPQNQPSADRRRHRAGQDALLVHVHRGAVAREGEGGAGRARAAAKSQSNTAAAREEAFGAGRWRASCVFMLVPCRISDFSCVEFGVGVERLAVAGQRRLHARAAIGPRLEPDPQAALPHVQHRENAHDQQAAQPR